MCGGKAAIMRQALVLEFLKANWSDILAHIAQHAWLVFLSTAIAIVIGLPLGIVITRRKRLRGPVLGIANVMQTIPSLALFGLLIPLRYIGGIGPRTESLGLSFTRCCPSFAIQSLAFWALTDLCAKPRSRWA